MAGLYVKMAKGRYVPITGNGLKTYISTGKGIKPMVVNPSISGGIDIQPHLTGNIRFGLNKPKNIRLKL